MQAPTHPTQRPLGRLCTWRALWLLAAALLLSACGGGGGSSGGTSSGAVIVGSSIPGANVMTVTVDSGPAGSSYLVNRLYASVTVCQSGTSNCQTIDHVLVDTGSVGLRLLASEVSGALGLTPGSLHACQQYVDGSYTWGPVVQADVHLGNTGVLSASNIPIQLVQAQTNTGSTTCPQGSSAAITSTADLGAKGILGIGLFREDCGSACVSSATVGYYYSCAAGACTGTTRALASQIPNPAYRFPTDNNGLAVVLPAVGSSAVSLSGAVLFGIGTQSNNQPGSATRLATNGSGYITTSGGLLGGTGLGSQSISFMDTGSNGLFFGARNTPPAALCAASPWYCPATTSSGTATLTGANAVSKSVSFSVANANSLFATTDPVLPALAGWASTSSNTMFDWGLPFFYGRTIFIGIEGQTSPLGNGPFFGL